MASKRSRVLWVIVLLVAIGLVIGGAMTGLTVSASVGGRTITAESANILSLAKVEVRADGAVVHLGDLEVTVTNDLVTLPDGAGVAIPAGCTLVALRESGGSVRVMLDGAAAN